MNPAAWAWIGLAVIIIGDVAGFGRLWRASGEHIRDRSPD